MSLWPASDMDIQLTKAGTSDAPVLNAISKLAFDSDVLVGAPSAGGPPGYMSLKYHMKMARSGHLFKLTENGLIVGGAILFQDGDTLNISRICFTVVGFAVAMARPLYICIESAETISAPYFFASSTESSVFPEAVGPAMTSNGILSIRFLSVPL